MKMSDAAKIVLSEANQPMHVNALVKEIEARELFKFGAKNPSAVLSGTLNKDSARFEKSAPGMYQIKK